MLSLWDHQKKSLDLARRSISNGYRSILIQGVTGTGKTRMLASAINSAISKKVPGSNLKQNVWFIVPRRELLWQSSREFSKWKIQHGMISAKSKENTVFQVHICSKNTLIKRIKENKIKIWADIIIIDEAHLAIDHQLKIKEKSPKSTIFLGVTATPERLDGRPLLGMWDIMIEGEQMQWFVEHKFLKHPLVMSVPPIERLPGLSELKSNKAGDVNTSQLIDLYEKRANGESIIYGNEIEHYRKYGIGRSVLIFCRSIDQSILVAKEFSSAGLQIENIDGKMSDKIRQRKIMDVENNVLLGLTTVDLCTYGLDVPKISCIIMLRPTESLALFFQMIGRGMRYDDTNDRLLILDHVGNCDDQKHGHPLLERKWNFAGHKEKKKIPKEAIELISSVGKCSICYDIIIDGACRTCGAKKEIKESHDIKKVDGWLVEIKEPTPLRERPLENQRYYINIINDNINIFRESWYENGKNKGGIINHEAIKKLLEIAHELKRNPLWVYYSCVFKNDFIVNVSLLKLIGEIKGYKKYWMVMKRKELEFKYNIVSGDD